MVEMTPSRPELRHREENTSAITRLGTSQSHASDAITDAQQNEDASRQDSSISTPAALEDVIVDAPDSTNAPPKYASPTLEPLSILVVDDDALTRKLMTRLLTRLGCIVTTAENGLKALEILLGVTFTPSEIATPSTVMPSTPGTVNNVHDPISNQPRFFDVVFLDNQMPQMSGLETIARLRAVGREDLVVGVTGNALIRDQDEYLTAGADHVLIKPVVEKSLREMLSLAKSRRIANAAGDSL